jgi:hypothetical protein
MSHAGFNRWLRIPLVTGRLALFCAVAAVAVPTIVRAAAHGVVTGCEFTPYLPFVLIIALALGWWQAGAVALAAVAILGGLLFAPTSGHFTSSCFLSGAAMFLASSAMIIGVVVLVKRLIAAIQFRGASKGGIVFSLQGNEVWASWYDKGPPVRLGTEGNVSEMMQDFLAQVELGKRLTGHK